MLSPFLTGPTLPAKRVAKPALDTDETQALEGQPAFDTGGFDLAMPLDDEQDDQSTMDEALNTANAENAESKPKVLNCEQTMGLSCAGIILPQPVLNDSSYHIICPSNCLASNGQSLIDDWWRHCL